MDEQKPEENIKTIHTYSSDMADAVRQNEVSVIKVALAEQKRHEQEALAAEHPAGGTKTTKTFLLLGALIIILGASGILYYVYNRKNATVAPLSQNILQFQSLIAYDDSAAIDMTNATSMSDALGILRAEIEKGVPLSGIKAIVLTRTINTTEILPIEKLFSLLKINAPSSLVRSFNTPYLLGMYKDTNADSSPHLFLLITSKDFNQSYAGMLGWEKTMVQDLFPLFKIDVTGTRQNLLDKQWKDIVLDNRNARILYDSSGADVLYYIFINTDSIIVTDSQDTIKEIATRLRTKKTKPL